MGIFLHLIKLPYVRHAKAGVLRPTRPRGLTKIIRFKINYKLDYTCGISDDALTELFCKAVEKALDERRKSGLPIVRYNGEQKKVYLEYPDGTKEYV